MISKIASLVALIFGAILLVDGFEASSAALSTFGQPIQSMEHKAIWMLAAGAVGIVAGGLGIHSRET